MNTLFATASRTVASCLREDPTFGLLTPAEQRAEARALLAKIEGVDPDDVDLQLEALSLAAEKVERRTVTEVVDTGLKRIVVTRPAEEPAEADVFAELDQAIEEMEEAVAAIPVGWQPAPCRLDAAVGKCPERLSATGRCMDCGAQRRKPPEVARPAVDLAFTPPPPEMKKAEAKKRRNAHSVAVVERRVKGIGREPYIQKQARLVNGNVVGRVKAVTQCPDSYLGKLLRKTRPTVQAYCAGRIEPVLNRWQIGQLKGLLNQQRIAIEDLLSELEALDLTADKHARIDQ